MKRILAVTLLLVQLIVSGTVYAEEVKMIGTISKIEMAADQKSATVVLKDVKTEKDVTVIIEDDLTLDKFKDKRIIEGDEIRCKYDNENGKNISKLFKKTAGC